MNDDPCPSLGVEGTGHLLLDDIDLVPVDDVGTFDINGYHGPFGVHHHA